MDMAISWRVDDERDGSQTLTYTARGEESHGMNIIMERDTEWILGTFGGPNYHHLTLGCTSSSRNIISLNGTLVKLSWVCVVQGCIAIVLYIMGSRVCKASDGDWGVVAKGMMMMMMKWHTIPGKQYCLHFVWGRGGAEEAAATESLVNYVHLTWYWVSHRLSLSLLRVGERDCGETEWRGESQGDNNERNWFLLFIQFGWVAAATAPATFQEAIEDSRIMYFKRRISWIAENRITRGGRSARESIWGHTHPCRRTHRVQTVDTAQWLSRFYI